MNTDLRDHPLYGTLVYRFMLAWNARGIPGRVGFRTVYMPPTYKLAWVRTAPIDWPTVNR